MYYVHFCAKYGFLYHTVVEYGQNEWYVNDGADFMPGPHVDASKAVPGLDMQELCDSAAASWRRHTRLGALGGFVSAAGFNLRAI